MRLPPPMARRLGAIFTASAGLMNVLSALYPAVPSRMDVLRDLLPVHLIQNSQTAAVLTGFFLILLADGLRKRRMRAMQITIGLLFASCVFNMAKGLDYEEAVVSAVLGLGLLANRSAFDISSVAPVPRRLVQQAGTFALLYYCYILLGFLLLRRAITPVPTALNASLEPLRLLVGVPLYHYLSPQAQWFERSMICLGSVAAVYAFVQILRPLIPRRTATAGERQRVHDIVRLHGADTLSYFALQDGRSYFFDDSGEAFLSYRLWRTVAIVAGDPVGPVRRIPALVSSFLEWTEANAVDACFVGVSGASLELYERLGLRSLKIGEEALIDLAGFDISSLKRKVRRAVRHVEEVGIRAHTFRRDTLPHHIEAQLLEISREWVAANGGTERGFTMTLGRLPGAADADCELTVALEGDFVWGFVSIAPAYAGGAWSLDAMRRRSGAPNGLMELLIVRAAESYRDRGYRTLSLNFATLSNTQNDIDSRALDGTR